MDIMGNAVRAGSNNFHSCNDVVGVAGVIFRSTQATQEPKSVSGVITEVQVLHHSLLQVLLCHRFGLCLSSSKVELKS